VRLNLNKQRPFKGLALPPAIATVLPIVLPVPLLLLLVRLLAPPLPLAMAPNRPLPWRRGTSYKNKDNPVEYFRF
jgi:hypothetical protein